MKKSILTLLLMLVSLATFAEDWTRPVSTDYEDRYVIYAQPKVNGTLNSTVQICAMIDGQVRGIATYEQDGINQPVKAFVLQVYGNQEDQGKTITFKIKYDELVYKSTKTLTYSHGGTYQTIPFVLNVDAITGVSITNPLEIIQNTGTTYDLTDDVTIQYGGTTGESSLDTDLTPLTYTWDYSNSSDCFSVNANNVLTVNGYGENKYLGLEVTGGVQGALTGFSKTAYTEVTTKKPAVPVTSLSLSLSSITVNVMECVWDYVDPLVTILPADADNKDFDLVPNDAEAVDALGSKYTALKPGTFNFKVVSAENSAIYAPITINIVQPVTLIQWSGEGTGITIWKGDNAFTEIAKNVTVQPANATDKTLTYSCDDAAAFDADGIALKKGTFTVNVGAEKAAVGLNPLPVSVTVKQHVTSITATPSTVTVNVGDNVVDYILQNTTITVLPTDADDKTYNVIPSSTDESVFPNNIATTAGTYTWTIQSVQDPTVTASITVNVIVPVTFTLPQKIDATLLTPGQGAITNVTGNFNANLVTFQTGSDDAEIVMSGNNIIVTGKKIASGQASVSYDGKSMGSFNYNIGAEVKLKEGWNWVGTYTTGSVALQDDQNNYLASYFSGDNMIMEARSQSKLLYNDTENYGVFGTITSFNPETMYKIRVKGDRSIYPTGDPVEIPVMQTATKGYTWFAYTVIGDHSFDFINSAKSANAYDGCLIIGKDGFAEFNDGAWVASAGFKLETGKGYIFYQPQAEQMYLQFADHYQYEAPSTSAKGSFAQAADVWQYDANAYADNMAIVAKLNNVPADPRYTVGAFVGEECRGKGTFVTDDVMFINVAGQSGEKVNFRLCDTQTGNCIDILEGMNYTMKAGSIKSPVMLNAEYSITGVNDAKSETSVSTEAVNVLGQAVSASAKGIVIVNGKKFYNK